MDFSNISDYDFEGLARDVVSRILGARLSCYAPGPDGGIDAGASLAYRADDERTIIVQAKRYITTSASQLVADARKLAGKLIDDDNAPDVLYFVTSRDLSKKKACEIAGELARCCPEAHVVHKRDLEDFLANEANRDILRRYVGLWLPDISILQEHLAQDCLIDGLSLLEEIESRSHVYRSTTMFQDALQICQNNGVCLIVGPPGVGKTCLSHLLVMYYASLGYQLRFSYNNDVSSLKRALSLNPSVKEVCFMDDFLGQRYYKMQENRPSEVASLIRFVQRARNGRARNKVLVLNSRLTIVREAMRVDGAFRQWLSENGMSAKIVLDAEKLTRRDKFDLLCAQLVSMGVEANYIESLRTRESYRRIIDNWRYNPRVIEALCNRAAAHAVPPGQFVHEVLKALENPAIVWGEEYRDRLRAEDRTLLDVLFSLTDKMVDEATLKACYLRRCERVAAIDPTASSFDSAITRLSESMIRQGVSHAGGAGARPRLRTFGVLNPSINDFIEATLRENDVELRGLLQSAHYADQALRLSLLASDGESLRIVDGMLESGTILDMDWLENDAGSCYLQMARFRDWRPCNLEDVIRAIGLCMNHFPGVAPVLDFIKDCDYEAVDSFDFSAALDAIVSDENRIGIVNMWPDDEVGLYFALAFRFRPGDAEVFAELMRDWLGEIAANRLDDVAWEQADAVISQYGTSDEEGYTFIDAELIEQCADHLATTTHEALADMLEGLFEYHADAAEWLELDPDGIVAALADSYDYEDCVAQVASTQATLFQPNSTSDISDEEIKRTLAQIAESAS